MVFSIFIPDANPDVFGEVVTHCTIHGASGRTVYVAVVVEDGTADPDPCSWRNSVYAEHASSASEVTVHGAFRCKLEPKPSNEAIDFSFRLHTVPIKTMCGREFRIAAYADRNGRELLGLSKPFRNVVYKVRILEEPNLLKIPQPGDSYSFDVNVEPMVLKVALSAGDSDRVIPVGAKVLLDLMLVDAVGKSRNDLIKRAPEGMSCWWTMESGGVVLDNSDYTTLPVLLKCVIIDPISVPVAIRVSVESVENAGFTSTDVGSCETPLFTTLSSGGGSSPNGSSGQAVAGTTGGLLLAAPELTTEIPLEYQGDTPKEKLMRWVHMAMVALQKTRTTTDFSNLDRELLFEVLSRYHLLGIEECVDMLEVVTPACPPAVQGRDLVQGGSITTSKSGSSLWSQDSEVAVGSVNSANRN